MSIVRNVILGVLFIPPFIAMCVLAEMAVYLFEPVRQSKFKIPKSG
jgi:hypothetical protein